MLITPFCGLSGAAAFSGARFALNEATSRSGPNAETVIVPMSAPSPTIVAASQGTPPIVAIAVLPTPVGDGGRPAGTEMSNAPLVTTRMAGVAVARAAAVKLNVPAMRVPVRAVSVMNPAAPLDGVIQLSGDSKTAPPPPGE